MAQKTTQKNSKYDRLKQAWYDSRTIVSATTGEYQFFLTPVGATDAGESTAKTLFHTNQSVAGQMANKEAFLIQAVGVSLWQSGSQVSLAAAQAIMEQSQAYLGIYQRQEEKFVLPLFKFTSGHGIFSNAGTVDAQVPTYSVGTPAPQAIYSLGKHPIPISGNTPFKVIVKFEALGTVSGTVRLFVFLEGIRLVPKIG